VRGAIRAARLCRCVTGSRHAQCFDDPDGEQSGARGATGSPAAGYQRSARRRLVERYTFVLSRWRGIAI